jgi:hypothetical protein
MSRVRERLAVSAALVALGCGGGGGGGVSALGGQASFSISAAGAPMSRSNPRL